MADLAPYFNNADVVQVSNDGVTSTADSFGNLMAEGTTLGDPEVTTEALVNGKMIPTGFTQAYAIRVTEADTTTYDQILTSIPVAGDRYFHFTSRGGDKVFVIGPAKVTLIQQKGPGTTPLRGSYICAFNVSGDLPDDVIVFEDVT